MLQGFYKSIFVKWKATADREKNNFELYAAHNCDRNQYWAKRTETIELFAWTFTSQERTHLL